MFIALSLSLDGPYAIHIMKDALNYKPISCDFYDHIEIFAQIKNWVQIEYTSNGELVIEVAKISSTLTRDKIEYLITDEGQEIRMDILTQITLLNPAINMRVNLLQKLEYNHWSNQKINTHLKLLSEYPDAVLTKLSHIINAHDAWNRRILQLNQRFEIWQEWPEEEWPELFNHVHQEMRAILRRSPLDRVIYYRNSKEEPHPNNVADIIYHVINHSTYHRGQISDILSTAGLRAISTDYTLFTYINA